MQKITPFLWFDGQAEEAMRFYVSVFRDARVMGVHAGPDGKVMAATFEIEGMTFTALNGNRQHAFTPATSFLVSCKTQDEVDTLWARLTAGGGEPGQCGWLKDKYGVSWQVIPTALGELMGKDRSGRVVQAMLKMKKIEIAKLEQAYKG
jgi:predicted 3-demethylubiquinone-9 3-methyltransferase (glyoxalase superfamily)